MFDVVLNTPLFLVIPKVCAAVFIKEEVVCLVFVLVGIVLLYKKLIF